ncbi:alanyl-tRNA editing protein AlaXM [Sulfuracidifex tepidarius]|uniref:Alanyl-tRNA editing protein AlaX-M n=1 Tax=Sulfuracidifex tepidarius TaxID=1294262 RepID=A0A510E4X0_9CREN|nr:alanyl-tRNA editing protein AlaXM [Sulfuracidifex tepidarius]BBG24362.1 Alanyl-tRNA editing protein AlaX-M [Sulfuracidifex tepidarius]BBG27120.1 Alanyl-tRNA editing protein AlaX-M [Sulfuracidifex tepidarius]
MTKEVFQYDSYIKNHEAKVTRVEDGKILFLDETIFYPGGGGLEKDHGKIEGADVIDVKRDEGREIFHVLSSPLDVKEGDTVRCEIDWERRYRMMRLHTASHVMAAVALSKFNALVTGGNITPEQAKDDFSLESKDQINEIVSEANEIIKRGINVKVYFLPKEEAMKIPAIVKLAGRSPPDLPVWRIVEIEGIDIQADGGPHVRNTAEIGQIKLLKVENKGKNRKRVYYTV